jgi:hypothetical protein
MVYHDPAIIPYVHTWMRKRMRHAGGWVENSLQENFLQSALTGGHGCLSETECVFWDMDLKPGSLARLTGLLN